MNNVALAAQWSSASSMPMVVPHLLLVDDDRVMRMVLREALQHHGYTVELVSSAEEALELLQRDPQKVDALVLDRQLPGMSGLELVGVMKADMALASIPVIMLTGSGLQDEIQEGIDAGVHYYLVKPVENTLLRSIIDSALRERLKQKSLLGELSRYGKALRAMKNCHIGVKTLSEAEDTACFLATCFPDPERVVVGLMELLVNAVEHGNLGITYEDKQRLLATQQWREEIDRKAMLPEYQAREVEVIYQCKPEGYLVQITDAGAGFDWKRYWHINPARATASHGRGIARARLMAFDRMAYNEQGNRVTVMVNTGAAAGEGYAW